MTEELLRKKKRKFNESILSKSKKERKGKTSLDKRDKQSTQSTYSFFQLLIRTY